MLRGSVKFCHAMPNALYYSNHSCCLNGEACLAMAFTISDLNFGLKPLNCNHRFLPHSTPLKLHVHQPSHIMQVLYSFVPDWESDYLIWMMYCLPGVRFGLSSLYMFLMLILLVQVLHLFILRKSEMLRMQFVHLTIFHLDMKSEGFQWSGLGYDSILF